MATSRNRRSFLQKLAGQSTGKVKMLSSDGQLVEIDEEILKNARKRKATNEDIIDWSKNSESDKT